MKAKKQAPTKKPPAEEKPRKPRVLIVGGEKRNFKSGVLQERMDATIHLKGDGSRIKVQDASFDAVFSLPWTTFSLAKSAREWAKANRVPFVEVPKVGRIEFWLFENCGWARKYFEGLDRKELVAKKAETPPEPIEAVLKPLVEEHKWDEDQLWEAYGEEFVNKIKGLDGEVTDRKTFVELMESETGLKGEPVEILMMILRRQGVIAEDEVGVVSIGQVNPIDIEKKRKFIQRSEEMLERKPLESGSRSLREEVREAYPVEHGNSTGRSVEELLAFFQKLGDGTKFESTRALFEALYKAGLTHDGKPYTDNMMRRYLFSVMELGVKREPVEGNLYAFRLRLPGAGHRSVTAAPASIPEPESVPVPASVTPKVSLVQSVPAPVPAPIREALPVDFDISKTGVIYDLVSKSFPEHRIPDLVGLIEPVRALRGVFYESQWNRAAAIGVLQRVRIPVSDPNIMRVVQRKLDFTDDEWSWFSIEYLRDQTLMSLIPIIVITNELYRVCRECQDTFTFHVPSICWTCKGGSRKAIESAKGESS